MTLNGQNAAISRERNVRLMLVVLTRLSIPCSDWQRSFQNVPDWLITPFYTPTLSDPILLKYSGCRKFCRTWPTLRIRRCRIEAATRLFIVKQSTSLMGSLSTGTSCTILISRRADTVSSVRREKNTKIMQDTAAVGTLIRCYIKTDELTPICIDVGLYTQQCVWASNATSNKKEQDEQHSENSDHNTRTVYLHMDKVKSFMLNSSRQTGYSYSASTRLKYINYSACTAVV